MPLDITDYVYGEVPLEQYPNGSKNIEHINELIQRKILALKFGLRGKSESGPYEIQLHRHTVKLMEAELTSSLSKYYTSRSATLTDEEKQIIQTLVGRKIFPDQESIKQNLDNNKICSVSLLTLAEEDDHISSLVTDGRYILIGDRYAYTKNEISSIIPHLPGGIEVFSIDADNSVISSKIHEFSSPRASRNIEGTDVANAFMTLANNMEKIDHLKKSYQKADNCAWTSSCKMQVLSVAYLIYLDDAQKKLMPEPTKYAREQSERFYKTWVNWDRRNTIKHYIADNEARGVSVDIDLLGKIFLQSTSKTNRSAIVDMLGQKYPQLQDDGLVEKFQELWGEQIGEMLEEDRIKDAFVAQIGAKCGMELGIGNEKKIKAYLRENIMRPLVMHYTELYLSQGTNHHADYYLYLVMNHLSSPQNSIQATIELLNGRPLEIIKKLENEFDALPSDQQPEVLNWMKDRVHGTDMAKSSMKKKT